MKLKRLNVIFILPLLFIALLSSPTHGSSTKPTTVKLQLFWHHQFEFAGFYAAIQQGYFAKYNIDVELVEYEPGSDNTNKVLNGEVQFGLAGTDLIESYHQGKDVKLLASYFKRSPLTIITQPEITSLKQLVNKKIFGNNTQLRQGSIRGMLNLYNVELSKIKMTMLGDEIELFKNKKITGILAYRTHVPYDLNQQHIPYKMYDPNQFGIVSQDLNLFTTDTLSKNNPELVKNFTLAANEGWRYAIEHPNKIINLITAKYNTQNKTKEALLFEAQETIKLISPELFSVGSVQKNKLIAISEDLFANNTIPDIKSLDDFVFPLTKLQKIDIELYDLLTAEEKKYLDEHPIIKVQNESDYPPFNYTVNNNPTGYSIDYMETLAKIMGIEIQFIQGKPWSTYLEMLQKDKLDAIVNIMETPQRKVIYNFTTPFAEPNNVAVTRNGESITIIDTEVIRNKRLVVVDGYAASDKYEKLYPSKKIVKVNNVLEALDKVKVNEADFFISNDALINFSIEKHYIAGLKLVPLSEELNYPDTLLSIATNIKNPVLASIFQKAMSTIDEHETLALRKKWLGAIKEKSELRINLTPLEKKYLRDNPVIRVQNDRDYPPFNYLVDGKPSGYSIDLINLMGSMLGIKVELIKGKSWVEYMAMLERKELDILINIIDIESRHDFAGFTTPYVEIATFAVSRPHELSSIVSKEHLSDKRIVIAQGYAINVKLKKLLPKNQFVSVKDTAEALNLISSNQADVYFEVGAVLDYYMTKKLIPNLQLVPVSSDFEVVNQKFSIATHKDNKILLNMLEKTLNAIPDIEQIKLKRKWFGEKHTKAETSEIFTHDELEYIQDELVTLCRPALASGSIQTIKLVDFINVNSGLNIKVSRPLNWADSLTALKNKECDLLANATNTLQRQKTMAFTPEYFREKIAIITKKEQGTIYDLSDHSSQDFAIIKGLSIIRSLKNHYPDINLIEVETTLKGTDLVQQGKVFGFIYPRSFAVNLFDSHELSDLKINSSLRNQFDDLHALATRKDDKLLISILSKAVRNVDKEALSNIILNKAANHLTVRFNQTEKDYLKSNQVIWCSSDNADAWGELMLYLSKDTGMKLVKSKNMQWHEAIAALMNKECDVLPEATETIERSKVMNFTQPIHQEERVIVTRSEQPFIADIRDYLDKEFIIHKGDVIFEQLKKGYQGIKIRLVERQIEGLNLVSNGNAFAYIGSITDTGNVINNFSINNLKIAGTLSDKYNDSWALATRKNNTILSSIFTKIINDADKNKIRKIISGQLLIKYDKGFDYTMFWQMLIVAITLLLAVVFWNRRLSALNLQLISSKKIAEDAQEKVESQNRELLDTHQQLVQSEKMASLGTLTAGVAHEINNPTNFAHAAVYMMQKEIDEIKAFLKQLAGGDKADIAVINSFDSKFEKLIELTKTAKEGTQRIKVIVEDLRTFARLDNAKQAETKVSELIKSTVNLVKTQYENITISTDFDYDPLIDCYPSQLNQVFMNIIVNACQSIKTKLTENEIINADDNFEGMITICTSEQNNYLVININDNGGGMDKLTQQKVCEPFFTTKSVGSGTGLGMAISFGIIEDHDGMLKISSTLMQGSDFSIYLPVKSTQSDNKKL
jgi:ABC-type amino acid transport substrate-binding protein/nitrogen-specific signal transduction histidine kinase/ABC-type nitrate/sulfonate/bicarbonate transport system substrate-binding protein